MGMMVIIIMRMEVMGLENPTIVPYRFLTSIIRFGGEFFIGGGEGCYYTLIIFFWAGGFIAVVVFRSILYKMQCPCVTVREATDSTLCDTTFFHPNSGLKKHYCRNFFFFFHIFCIVELEGSSTTRIWSLFETVFSIALIQRVEGKKRDIIATSPRY